MHERRGDCCGGSAVGWADTDHPLSHFTRRLRDGDSSPACRATVRMIIARAGAEGKGNVRFLVSGLAVRQVR